MSEDILRKMASQARKKAQTARLTGEVTAAIIKARNHGLNLFRPLPPEYSDQELFLRETCFGQTSIGGNRCLAQGTLVRTLSGNKAIEEIQSGEFVFDQNGEPIEVVKTFRNGVKPVVGVWQGGRVVAKCTKDHQFLLHTESHGQQVLALNQVRREFKAYFADDEGVYTALDCEVIDFDEEIETFDIHVQSRENLYQLASGMVTHNSGKSVGAAVKFAAIALGKKIRTFAGEEIECRRPHQIGRKLEMWVIGYDWEHIGHTIHKMLFEPQLFKTITDRETGQLRAWEPWNPDDAARADEARWAPPLIPESEVIEFAWVNKAMKQFSRVDLKNGNTIYAFASTGAVKAGDAVDVIWIDEKIAFQEYVAEWQARLVDNRGNFLWSSWPYGDNPALRNMFDRWELQKGQVERGEKDLYGNLIQYDTRAFHSTFEKNPYLDAKEKAAQIDRWGAKEARARNLGMFVMDGTAIYPQFQRELHCAVYPEGHPLEDAISRILRLGNGIPPMDWCCELVLDPGTAKPCVLFCAIPPRKYWNGDDPPLIVWDEIYPHKGGRGMNADELAKAVWEKAGWDRIWNRWIIDGQAGRQTPMGFGKTIESNYSEAFHRAGLANMQTDVRFIAGSADFPTRANDVQKLLNVRMDGRPRLRIVTNRCPGLVLQMETNIKKMSNDVADERPAPNQMDDARNCLEYWASRSPTYVQPERLREKTETDDYLNWIAEQASGPRKEGVFCGRGS